jgi:hypothetical protein
MPFTLGHENQEIQPIFAGRNPKNERCSQICSFSPKKAQKTQKWIVRFERLIAGFYVVVKELNDVLG